MKFSCLPCSLFGEVISGKMSVADWSALAKEIGLDGFDITILFVRDRTPAGLAKMRRELETSGLPVLMMSIYPDLTDLRPGVFEKELIRAKSDIAVASDLGVQIVRITAGQFHPESDPEKQLSQAIRGILEAKEWADRCHVGLVWENHSKPGAWEHPDFNYDRERLFKMADALKGSGVGMNYDVANAHLLGLGPDFLRECYSEIRTVHLNDLTSIDPIGFTGVFKGIVPIEENLKILKELGFDGVISVEEADGTGVPGVREAIARAKTVLARQGFI